jgi:Spy/CpxP family protein refolding chaperone
MNHKTSLLTTIGLLVLVAGIAFAQGHPSAPPAQPQGGPRMYGMQNRTGAEHPDLMSELTPDIQKQLIDLRIKFVNDNAQLMANIATKRMELQELWLDDSPNADKIAAAVKDLDALQLQLKLARINNQLAILNLLPPDLKKVFLQMHRRFGMGRGHMGRGMKGQGMGGMKPGMGMGAQ